MIVSAIATMSGSISPLAGGPNSAGRTSSALRTVDMTRPPSRGSTMTSRSRPDIVTRPEPDLVLVRHRLADHPEGLGGELAIRIHVIGRVEIDRIDLVAVDKAVEVDDLRRFDLQRLQLVVVDRHIAAALVLVSLDDLVAVDDLAGLRVDRAAAARGCRSRC